MKQTRTIISVVGAMLVLLWLYRIAQPLSKPSAILVEPRLNSLEEPFQAIRVSHFMDGGSLGIEIIDNQQRRELFAIPNRMGTGFDYQTVFVGELYYDRPNAMEVADSASTKQALIYYLVRYRNGDPYVDAALAQLRRHPIDYTRCLLHQMRGDFQE